ncbi:hypothetical protein AK812_SmicGene452 [Symbiodinium microadriaticum]|uniref:Uncharacterized protein n=1 Tax=Symbiodinium microadriaticum TaxID=2951 RepID=A0A1Q9F6L8_SYMMI|nr:hypothetical protein AK812_SmicGene452 [Symbiodinium microadriaticum]
MITSRSAFSSFRGAAPEPTSEAVFLALRRGLGRIHRCGRNCWRLCSFWRLTAEGAVPPERGHASGAGPDTFAKSCLLASWAPVNFSTWMVDETA